MRTMEEVRTRLKQIEAAPYVPFDFRLEILQVRIPEGWRDGHQGNHLLYPLTEEFVRGEIVAYLEFAFDKAHHERGLSAIRSVQKLEAWAWLLGRDELEAFARDDINYEPYGLPVLKRFAQAFDFRIPEAG